MHIHQFCILCIKITVHSLVFAPTEFVVLHPRMMKYAAVSEPRAAALGAGHFGHNGINGFRNLCDKLQMHSRPHSAKDTT